MTLDARARSTAKRLIDKYGRSVTLVSRGAPTRNLDTGVATAAEASIALKTVEDAPSRKDLDRGVLATSSILIMAAADLGSVEPKSGDKVTDGSKTWTVGLVGYISSGEQKAMYRVEVRV